MNEGFTSCMFIDWVVIRIPWTHLIELVSVFKLREFGSLEFLEIILFLFLFLLHLGQLQRVDTLAERRGTVSFSLRFYPTSPCHKLSTITHYSEMRQQLFFLKHLSFFLLEHNYVILLFLIGEIRKLEFATNNYFFWILGERFVLVGFSP